MMFTICRLVQIKDGIRYVSKNQTIADFKKWSFTEDLEKLVASTLVDSASSLQ